MDSNTGLEFGIDTFRTITRDGELVAIERENGHIERYITERSTNAKSNEIFGVKRV